MENLKSILKTEITMKNKTNKEQRRNDTLWVEFFISEIKTEGSI